MTRCLSVILAGLVTAACTGKEDPPAVNTTQPVLISTVTVKRERRGLPIRIPGVLAGKEEVRLSFKVSGIVDRVLVDEGASVTVGQVLAVLKQSEIAAGVVQATRGLEKAQRDLDRVKDLFQSHAATLEQLQNATTATDIAQAALSSATFNRDYASIRAPAAGKIVRRMVENEELVNAGAPVLTMRSTRRGWVLRVGISDRDLTRVALGTPASVSFDGDETHIKASISEIAESSSAGTGTFEIELALQSQTPGLRSGMIGRAEILPIAKREMAFIPVESLVEGKKHQASVFILAADDTAQRRVVNVSYIDGGEAAIDSGLENAKSVITEGTDRLADGTRVRLQIKTQGARP